MNLSQLDLGFFARNGFLHVRSAIDPEACEQLVAKTWECLPSTWSKDDCATWSGPVQDSCHTADVNARRGLMKFQKGPSVENDVVDGAFASYSAGGDIARALIGYPLANMRIRGLYAIAPTDKEIIRAVYRNAHIESHAVQLIALCYLDDVEQSGGGLLVWPGSHRDLYPKLGSKLEHIKTPAYDQSFAECGRLKPIEVPGSRGDIVIIHHRLLHAPSLNRSSKIRFGFLCDYQREDFEELCTQRPGLDLWEDWPAISALPDEIRDAPSDFTLKLQPKYRDVPVAAPTATPEPTPPTLIEADPSDVRKGDASTIARVRQEGDIWFVLSDFLQPPNPVAIAPLGSDLTAEGVTVRINGKLVPSLCRYDIINRLETEPRSLVVEFEGLPRPCILRLIKVRLPFRNSELLFNAQVGQGQSRFEITDASPQVLAAA